MIKNKESSYLNYWDVNNFYGWAMSQKLPGNNFEWIEETSQFNEPITKRVMKYFFSFFSSIPKKNTRTSHGLTIFIREDGTWKN